MKKNIAPAFQKIAQAPTNPKKKRAPSKRFDVEDLYDTATDKADIETGLGEKFRQAYFWMINTAIISPFYDIEYNDKAPMTYTFGGPTPVVSLPTDQSYSSFILLPLLNLAVRRWPGQTVYSRAFFPKLPPTPFSMPSPPQ